MRGGKDTQAWGWPVFTSHPTFCYLSVEADIGAADIQYNFLAEPTVGADLQQEPGAAPHTTLSSHCQGPCLSQHWLPVDRSGRS